jgi:hypothetical protein
MYLAAAVVALFAVTTRVEAQQIAGNWEGYWSRAGDTMPVTLHVQRDSGTGGYSASFDVDRLRAIGIPFNEVTVQGCCDVTFTVKGDRTTTTLLGKLRGDSLSGTLREGESEGQFAFARSRAAPAFNEQEMTFTNGSVTLAGSLILPATGNSLPAIVFLQGSGPEGRWASRYMATLVVSQGFAALIFDKRGVGKSSGDWRQATPDDLASDGAAAITRLTQEPRINPARIGIYGHSQGGTLAPLVAARSGKVAFVIGSAAAGVPTDSTEIYSILNSVYPQATTAADSASARTYTNELVAVAYHGRPRARLDSLVARFGSRPWFFSPPAADNPYWSFSKGFAQYRPLDWWAKVQVPVLLIYGGDDQRVPPRESAARITTALLHADPGADVTVRIFPGADHTFRLPSGPSGWPVTAPNYTSTLLQWLALRR